MRIPSYNFHIHAGNTGTIENSAGIVIRFKDEDGDAEVLTGSFVFVARLEGMDDLRKEAEIVVSGGTVTVPITVSDSRYFPAPSRPEYELEQRLGTSERTRLMGRLQVQGGINDDQ